VVNQLEITPENNISGPNQNIKRCIFICSFGLKFEFTSLEESIPDKESEIYRNKGFEKL
jgi:hypothetical protein